MLKADKFEVVEVISSSDGRIVTEGKVAEINQVNNQF